ncbi:MAG: multicopper oxidase family protein, partial [Micromonosporaceae bacterium]
MTATGQLIALDLLITVLTAAGWLGAGVAAAVRRPRTAVGLLGVALLATLARVGSVVALAGAGWWFVQEKVLVSAPLLGVTAVVAVALAGPRLIAAVRHRVPAEPAVAVPLLAAGYASVAGLLVTMLHGYPATWSAGLVTTAAVAAAVLATWRVLSRPPDGSR